MFDNKKNIVIYIIYLYCTWKFLANQMLEDTYKALRNQKIPFNLTI